MKLLSNFKITQKLLLKSLVILTLFVSACGPGKKTGTTHAETPESRRGSEPRIAPEVEVSLKDHEAKIGGTRSERQKVREVISAARSFIGTPYRYGGTTKAGMDCSGLLLNSFKAIQVDLPRSSDAQSRIGRPVKIKDLQPGDLVFFATGKNRKTVTHVGLVTQKLGDKDVKFIHASSTLGVVETNISGEYYQQRYLGARRVID